MTNSSRRVLRMEKELQQVIASYLLFNLKGPLYGMVSVAKVGVSKDLRTAKVYVSVMGTEEDRQATEEKLAEQRPAIQHHINKVIKTKFCPVLNFAVAQSSDPVYKSDRYLMDLNQDKPFSPS